MAEMLKTWNYAVTTALVCLALYALFCAYSCQMEVDGWYEFLQRYRGHSIPPYYFILDLIAAKQAAIPQFVSAGLILLGLGYLLCHLPDLKEGFSSFR